MHVAYLIGLFAGVGAALGLGVTGSLRRWELGLVVSAVVVAVIGLVLSRWPEAVAGVVGAAAGAFGSAPLVAGTLRRGGTRGGTAALLAAAAVVGAGARPDPGGRLPRSARRAALRAPAAPPRARPPRGPAHARARLSTMAKPKPVILVVIDGLTPSMFEAGGDADAAPARRAR